MTIGFIGAGRMAQAMARGFIANGVIKAKQIIASDPNPKNLKEIQDLGCHVTKLNTDVVRRSNMVVLAVKPIAINPVLKEIAPIFTREKVLISIVAGIQLSMIEEELPKGSKVIRVMPNLNALVQEAATVMAPGKEMEKKDTEYVQELLQSIGLCEPGSEKFLDAVTGLSGSGPAYAYTAIEALADGGVKMGLPRDLALKLAAQTLLGAARMVLESGKHPGELKDEVCSPGGTTITAMHELERHGFRSTLIDAVEASTLKAIELGELEEQAQTELKEELAEKEREEREANGNGEKAEKSTDKKSHESKERSDDEGEEDGHKERKKSGHRK